MKLRSGWSPANQIYCACLAQAGQLDEARAALARLKELHPAISVAWIQENTPWKPGPMAKFVEGMSKAGLEYIQDLARRNSNGKAVRRTYLFLARS